MFASVLVLSLVTSVTVAAPPASADPPTARADLNTLAGAAPVPAVSPHGVDGAIDGLRDSAALVLVGGMLIGLAAAVRRTA